jgi:tetratricopeptide (TPR) repeat protein
MRVSATPFSHEGQLRAIERLIEQAPDDVSLRFARACCLEDLGHPDEARTAYAAVLGRESTHFGALTNLGSMFLERHDPAAARPYFVAAAVAHPSDPVGHVNLGLLYTETHEFESALAHFNAALGLRSDHFYALLGMGELYERAGDRANADLYLTRAFAKPYIWSYPYRGTGTPVRILTLASPRGGDIVSNLFFDEQVVERKVFVPEAYRPGCELPAHDLLFNVIGDVDRCRASLERARAVVADTQAPVLNDPAAVLATARDEIMRRLRGIPGLVAPLTERFPRAELTAPALAARGFAFPLLLRSPGFHTGDHFVRVAGPGDLPAAIAILPGDELLAIEELATRAADGFVRKYRMLFVDHRPYPLHLAVSPNWKVHYFSSDMFERADHRDEEAAFLNDPETALGSTAVRALADVAGVLALDYGGVDFGLDAAGNVLAFEANATMAIYPPSDAEHFAYRRAAADRALAAVHAMIVQKARPAA